MAKKSSNRDRIARRAQEAAVAADEKKTTKKTAKKTAKKATKKKAKKTAKKAAPTQRVKVVWKVFDGNFKEVACFPYPEKDQADARAAELSKKKNKEFFVNSAKVPMEDEE